MFIHFGSTTCLHPMKRALALLGKAPKLSTMTCTPRYFFLNLNNEAALLRRIVKIAIHEKID